MNERFGIDYIVDVVLGKENPQIKTYKHDQLKSFGTGLIMEMEVPFWESLIRQMMLEGFIRKDIEEYGLLKITDEGRNFLKKPYSIRVSMNHEYRDLGENDYAEEENGASSHLDPKLYESLLKIRKQVAEKNNLPPYTIFLEQSLEDMCISYPTTQEEMSRIFGVSRGKALKFGRPFLNHIVEYVEENDVIRPDDFVMKNVVNRNANKIYIIQNVDRQIPLDNIASNRDMSIEELIKAMEEIVYSGTKLNVNYLLEDMDDEELEDVLDYFKEIQEDNIDEIYEEFKDDDISYEQVQLIRLKFLSLSIDKIL